MKQIPGDLMIKQELIHKYTLPWTLHDLLLRGELLGRREGPEKSNQDMDRPKRNN